MLLRILNTANSTRNMCTISSILHLNPSEWQQNLKIDSKKSRIFYHNQIHFQRHTQPPWHTLKTSRGKSCIVRNRKSQNAIKHTLACWVVVKIGDVFPREQRTLYTSPPVHHYQESKWSLTREAGEPRGEPQDRLPLTHLPPSIIPSFSTPQRNNTEICWL